MKNKVLIADDHSLIREGMKQTFEQLLIDPQIYEASTASEVDALVAKNEKFSIIILDLRMPGADGIALVQRVCDHYADIPVVVLSASERKEDIRQAIDSGAAGFVPKSSGSEVMLNALRLILSGGTYIPRELLVASEENDLTVNADQVSPGFAIEEIEGITQRQRDVLRLVLEGMSNKQIARELGLSENTVKVHLSAIFRVIGVSNRTQAVIALKNESR